MPAQDSSPKLFDRRQVILDLPVGALLGSMFSGLTASQKAVAGEPARNTDIQVLAVECQENAQALLKTLLFIDQKVSGNTQPFANSELKTLGRRSQDWLKLAEELKTRDQNSPEQISFCEKAAFGKLNQEIRSLNSIVQSFLAESLGFSKEQIVSEINASIRLADQSSTGLVLKPFSSDLNILRDKLEGQILDISLAAACYDQLLAQKEQGCLAEKLLKTGAELFSVEACLSYIARCDSFRYPVSEQRISTLAKIHSRDTFLLAATLIQEVALFGQLSLKLSPEVTTILGGKTHYDSAAFLGWCAIVKSETKDSSSSFSKMDQTELYSSWLAWRTISRFPGLFNGNQEVKPVVTTQELERSVVAMYNKFARSIRECDIFEKHDQPLESNPPLIKPFNDCRCF